MLNTFKIDTEKDQITDQWVKKIKTNHCCCDYTSQAKTEASRTKNLQNLELVWTRIQKPFGAKIALVWSRTLSSA